MPAALCDATVLDNTPVAEGLYRLAVRLPHTAAAPVCGQFYMLRAWGADEAPLLSRPISVHDWDAATHTLVFLYEVKGVGTQKLAQLAPDDTLRLTGPAGNGFPVADCGGKTVAVVGGGVGTAPLLYLAKSLAAAGATVDFYAGFRDMPYLPDAYRSVCRTLGIATDSGRFGTRGFVTDLVPYAQYDAVYVCGPEVMMEKVARACRSSQVTCWVSKEAKMACGVGACLGCTCKTADGHGVSVCKDGPVFEGSVVYGVR